MNFVDLGKKIKEKIVDKSSTYPFVFHHVPKCGGTSVGRALRKRHLLSQVTVTPESSFRAFESFTGRNDRENMLVDVLPLREQMLLYHMFEGVRCISLHVGFSDVVYREFGDVYKFITILRNPIERFVSHYYWSYGKPQAHARIEETFDDFLESPRALRLGAVYVEYFCGDRAVDIRSSSSIKNAISNLKLFSVVGHLENLSAFESGIRTELGFRIKVGHENKINRSKRALKTPLTDTQLEKIKILCSPDLEVWNSVTLC